MDTQLNFSKDQEGLDKDARYPHYCSLFFLDNNE